MRWIPRIQQAIADERFVLYYQPIVPIGSNPSTGAAHGEILLRMVDEAGRIVLPDAFLPAAERYGLMLALDRWVVRGKAWKPWLPFRTSGREVAFAINISGQSLGAADFLDFVIQQIESDRGGAKQALLRDHRDFGCFRTHTGPALHGRAQGIWLPIRLG